MTETCWLKSASQTTNINSEIGRRRGLGDTPHATKLSSERNWKVTQRSGEGQNIFRRARFLGRNGGVTVAGIREGTGDTSTTSSSRIVGEDARHLTAKFTKFAAGNGGQDMPVILAIMILFPCSSVGFTAGPPSLL